MNECDKITNEGITMIAELYPNILSFSFPDEYTDFDNKNVSDVSVKKNCRDVSWTLISQCHMSGESICAIGWSCPNLEQLYLEGCNITDISIHALANLCSNLQKLNVGDCVGISVN